MDCHFQALSTYFALKCHPLIQLVMDSGAIAGRQLKKQLQTLRYLIAVFATATKAQSKCVATQRDWPTWTLFSSGSHVRIFTTSLRDV